MIVSSRRSGANLTRAFSISPHLGKTRSPKLICSSRRELQIVGRLEPVRAPGRCPRSCQAGTSSGFRAPIRQVDQCCRHSAAPLHPIVGLRLLPWIVRSTTEHSSHGTTVPRSRNARACRRGTCSSPFRRQVDGLCYLLPSTVHPPRGGPFRVALTAAPAGVRLERPFRGSPALHIINKTPIFAGLIGVSKPRLEELTLSYYARVPLTPSSLNAPSLGGGRNQRSRSRPALIRAVFSFSYTLPSLRHTGADLRTTAARKVKRTVTLHTDLFRTNKRSSSF